MSRPALDILNRLLRPLHPRPSFPHPSLKLDQTLRALFPRHLDLIPALHTIRIHVQARLLGVHHLFRTLLVREPLHLLGLAQELCLEALGREMGRCPSEVRDALCQDFLLRLEGADAIC